MTKNQALFVVFSAFILSACSLPSSLSGTPTPTPNPELIEKPTVAPVVVKTKLWDDPAGFKLSYPENLSFNSHPEDNKNYANLDIGPVHLLMQDNTFKSLSAWASSLGGDSASILLGGKTAARVTTATKVIIGAIDDNILVTIESSPANVVLLNDIASSFEFVYPTPAPSNSSAGTSEDILEEISD